MVCNSKCQVCHQLSLNYCCLLNSLKFMYWFDRKVWLWKGQASVEECHLKYCYLDCGPTWLLQCGKGDPWSGDLWTNVRYQCAFWTMFISSLCSFTELQFARTTLTFLQYTPTSTNTVSSRLIIDSILSQAFLGQPSAPLARPNDVVYPFQTSRGKKADRRTVMNWGKYNIIYLSK